MINFLLTLCLSLVVATFANAATPQFFLPKTHLEPADLAIIVNDNDPVSVRIGEYYQSRRGIPNANMIHVHFATGASVMSRAEFARIKAEVDEKTPEAVQAYALTWAAPYRVDCMSITSAFAFGFDQAYCSQGCGTTKMSPYYNSPSLGPHHDHQMRPTMALAGINFESVKALIDRGVAADETHPSGTGYLVNTHDTARNVRATQFPEIIKAMHDLLHLQLIDQDHMLNKKDVLFYFTGVVQVPGLEGLKFVPGALADHLTSLGGQLTDSSQMSSLRWLEAGATGSYGAVVEPCNHLGKFPNPGMVIFWYLRGASLIEAYWKSVAWPGEGVFIGEPLAAPFSGYRVSVEGDELVMQTQALPPGVYVLSAANSLVGPYDSSATPITVAPGKYELRLKDPDKAIYRLDRIR